MNYQFQRFTSIYPIFVRQFLADNPDYESLAYGEMYDRFVNTWYGLSDFHARHMKNLGNDAQNHFASLEPLQKTWARENNVSYNETNWVKDIALAQVKAFKPNVIYLDDLDLFDQSFRQQVREVLKGNVIIIGWRSSLTNDFTIFKDLNLILSAANHMVHKLRQVGANAIQMPLGFEDTLLEVIKPTVERDLDFTFVGSLGSRYGQHSRRCAIIEKLMPSTPLQVWGDYSELGSRSTREQSLFNCIHEMNKVLRRMGVSERLREKLPLIRRGVSWIFPPTSPSLKQLYHNRVHEPLFGLKYYEILARSKIVFNNHIDCAEDLAGNVRLYEATGMGACLLTDWKTNLPDLFEIDVDVVTYRSAEECIEKVSYLLEHESLRKAISDAGQRRTLKEHTFAQRMARLNEIILEMLTQ